MKKILMIFTLVIATIFCSNIYAEEEAWIEVRCQVPERFEYKAIELEFVNDRDGFYELTLLKENNYIGRMKLPYGKYFYSRGFAANDTKYDYIVDCDPQQWEIKLQDKATLLNLTVKYEPLFEEKETVVSGVDNNELNNNVIGNNDNKEIDAIPNVDSASENGVDSEHENDSKVYNKIIEKEKYKVNYVGASITGTIILVITILGYKKITGGK